jgi:hypothetical protein
MIPSRTNATKANIIRFLAGICRPFGFVAGRGFAVAGRVAGPGRVAARPSGLGLVAVRPSGLGLAVVRPSGLGRAVGLPCGLVVVLPCGLGRAAGGASGSQPSPGSGVSCCQASSGSQADGSATGIAGLSKPSV